MDWFGLLRIGVTGLGLRPAEFWNLTPAEFWLMAGLGAENGAMDRTGLEALMALHPDAIGGQNHV
ncbi:MAG: rcc01693 family protein [Pseudoruegeria sp.]